MVESIVKSLLFMDEVSVSFSKNSFFNYFNKVTRVPTSYLILNVQPLPSLPTKFILLLLNIFTPFCFTYKQHEFHN